MNRLFALLTFGPLVLWVGCFIAVIALSGLGGCAIDEGNIHPCMVMGRDVGELAATLGIYAAWGPLIFGPFTIGAGMIWGIYAIVRALVRRR